MKFNEEQKELVALLPQDVKKYGLTDSAKLVLGQIIFMYGTDFAEENGFVFRSNEDLLNDTGIASKTTLLKAINQLVNKGLISTKRAAKGDRGTASEYVLNESVLQKCTIQDIDNQAFGKKCTIKCTNNCTIENQKCTIEIERKINDMELNIKELVEVIKELKEEIRDLKCTIETQKCTTDTESESDKEKESGNKDGNEGVHEWIDETIDFEYTDEMKKIGLNEVGNAEVKCLAQDQDNFNNSTKIKPHGNTNTSYSDKNKWITWYFDEMNSNLNALATSKTKTTISGLQDKIAELLQKGLDKQDDFSEKQWSVVQNFADRFIKLMEFKQQYLKSNNKNIVQTPINQASDVYSDDEWASKVEHSFSTEEATKDNSSDSSKEEVTQKSEAEELNDHMMKLFAELDEQDKATENKVLSTLTWDELPF